MNYSSSSAEQTQQIGSDFAQQFKQKGGIIALSGDLGAGKTTFTQGFARGLGIEDKIISPTFVLIRQHIIPDTKRTLFHIDLYRFETDIDIVSTGLKEIMEDPNNVVLIEWAEKIANQLSKDIIKINIKKIGENSREIEID